MARATQRRVLRRAAAPAVGACLLVLVASAGAQTAPGTASAAEPTAIGDATSVATGQFVSIAEGIGVADGTGAVSGQSVTVGETVSIDDATTTATGQVVGVGEGVGISDGTGTQAGQVVNVGEGVLVGDDTEAESANVSPAVLVGQLSGDEGSAATAAGSFVDADHGPWTALADYGDGTPAEPVVVSPDKSFTVGHVYDDDGAYLLTVTVTDAAGGSGTATASVAIDNVAPDAELDGGSGDEGAPVSVSFSGQTDPSADDTAAGFTYRYACDGATLGAETADASAACTFDDDGTYSVLARIADKDGGHSDHTAEVTVGNVAPTGLLANDGPVAEGAPATISWSGQSDPSAADTAAGFTYRYACDGVTLGPATADATATCAFGDDGTHTVLAQIADDDGGVTERTTDLVVENAAPTGELANDGPVGEGGSVTVSWSGQSDPSPADTAAGFTYRYACDGATLGPETADATATCSFDDGPGTHTVLARIADADGGFTDRTTDVAVENLPPTATLGSDGPVAEASPATISFAGQSDPSAADTAAGFTYRYACDGVTLGAPTADASAACAFEDDGTYTVVARITDKDGGSADLATTVEVTNVAPTATLVLPAAPVAEGSTFELVLADVFDPSAADTAAGFSIELDCGAGFGASATCTALDDPAHAVRARIADKDGGETILTGSVPVANVAPSATITGPPPGSLYQVGQPVTFTGTFTDPGTADTHTAAWSFNGVERTGTVTEAGGSGTASLVTTFTAAGVYTVELTVADGDGGVATAEGASTIVVFDPSAGFVTGGGWIQGASGKTTFGLSAKYNEPNQAVPTGNVELKGHKGGIDIRATGFEWLVVSGSTATLRGTASLDGRGDHTFLLTAVQGSPDRLRLEVWDGGGAVVHDSGLQPLGGGSIVVHRK